jgi:membrane-associated phospholipid phosphatase
MAWLNSFSGANGSLDLLISQAFMVTSVRMLPIFACLVWLWFRDDRLSHRISLIRGLTGAFIAIVISRVVQNTMFYRPRPIHNTDLAFVPPLGVDPEILREWSSFPSDTAALAFAVAAGVWIAHRRAGTLCLLWALVVVSFPRVYAGYHYPSDIIGGAIIGILSTAAAGLILHSLLFKRFAKLLVNKAAAFLYAASFVILYSAMTLFDDVRSLAKGLLTIMSQ